MIRTQVVERGINEPRLIDALRHVPRDAFFDEPDRGTAFSDRAAPIGFGQTISQPYMVALMTDRLQLEPRHRVLEIGTGSGYQTAVLARLCETVFSIERVKPLLDSAFERLGRLGVRNVRFRHGDGTEGWPQHAPFDRVLIAAGAPAIPRELLLSQLTDGGYAVLPVGDEQEQMLVRITRRGGRLDVQDICPCRFVKLVGREGWARPDPA